jgi:1,2-diacylglycerol 3-beta-galactosyltransferase
MVTIMTDMIDCPPHFWIERQAQYVVCGTAKAAQQAIAMGYPAEHVFRTSGMIVRPEFYRSVELSRAAERVRLGLDPERLTGIVMFGSFGSRQMASIASRIAESELGVQLIFVCGHNDKLREQIERMELPFPFHCVGFTREIPYLMQLADFFIGKPGPGSISEALVMSLPVVVERNARTMVQERFNTDWIAQNRVGIVLRSFTEIANAVSSFADPQQMAGFRASVRRIKNRAVFEIPDILGSLLHGRRESSRDSSHTEPTTFPAAI